MKQVKLILVFLVFGISTSGQEPVKPEKDFNYKNSVQLELFGHGLLYSFNYERLIFNGQHLKTTAQVGASYYPPSTGIIGLWIPVLINELISFNSHHIEFGLGYVLTNDDPSRFDKKWDGFLTGRLGYRYQKPKGRLVLRIGFTPFLEYQKYPDGMYYHEFHPSGGISAGYAF